MDLGLRDEELARMPYRRFVEWIAFYTVKAEKEAEAREKAERKSKSRRRRLPPQPKG